MGGTLMKDLFLKRKAVSVLLLTLILAVTLSSCGELVSRDDLADIYGGTAVVDGEKIWLGEGFDGFKLYSAELTSVSDQSAVRKEISGRTLYYVNVGKIKHFPLVSDSECTLYGNDYKVKIRYKWGEANTHDTSALASYVSTSTLVSGGAEVKYAQTLEGATDIPEELRSIGLTDTLFAETRAKAIYDNEHGQKRELVVHTAPGYYCYTVFADFEVYAVISYDPVSDRAEYTYVFLPVESSVAGTYLKGEREGFVNNNGSYQIIIPDAYRIRQLIPEVFGASGSDSTQNGTVVKSFTFTDESPKTIEGNGYFGLGLGSVRDLIDLSEHSEYLSGEYELKITVESTFKHDIKWALPNPCTREYCLYDRMPPPDGITGIVSESTARDEYGMIAYEKRTSETLAESSDAVTWTLDADKASEKMYLVYNATNPSTGDEPRWTLCSISIRVDIVKK